MTDATIDATTTDDETLSRRMTAAVRAVDGVVDVFPAQPVIEAAATAVAVGLALKQPDVLVDIDRAPGFTTFGVHIATSVAHRSVDVVRRVGEVVRDLARADPSVASEVGVNVKVRLIEGA